MLLKSKLLIFLPVFVFASLFNNVITQYTPVNINVKTPKYNSVNIDNIVNKSNVFVDKSVNIASSSNYINNLPDSFNINSDFSGVKESNIFLNIAKNYYILSDLNTKEYLISANSQKAFIFQILKVNHYLKNNYEIETLRLKNSLLFFKIFNLKNKIDIFLLKLDEEKQ